MKYGMLRVMKHLYVLPFGSLLISIMEFQIPFSHHLFWRFPKHIPSNHIMKIEQNRVKKKNVYLNTISFNNGILEHEPKNIKKYLQDTSLFPTTINRE